MLYGNHEEVSHDNNYAAELQEFYEAHESFGDPAMRRDYFGRMDENQFVDLTQQVTSIIRTGDSNGRQEYDGEQVGLMGHEVPEQQDKTDLIKETWQTARGFLNDPELDDKEALEYAGLTAAGGLLYAHPNIDGNGRMSRVVDHMIEEGTELPLDEMLPRILGENGNTDWHVAPDAAAMRAYAQRPMPKQINDYVIPEGVNWGNEDDIHELSVTKSDDPVERIADSSVGNSSLLLFMEHADQHALDVLEKYTVAVPGNDKNARTLNAKDALTELVQSEDGGIGYAAQLMEADRETRKQTVQRFLAMMKDRAQHEMPARLQKQMNLERSFPVDQALKAHFGRVAVGTQIVPGQHARAQHATYSRILREREGFEQKK
jgi:hypothetical protein